MGRIFRQTPLRDQLGQEIPNHGIDSRVALKGKLARGQKQVFIKAQGQVPVHIVSVALIMC